MAIVNRGAIRPGVELASAYKGGDHRATVADDGHVVLADGRSFRSLSGAAAAVAGTKVMNGWAFWTLVDVALDIEDAGDEPVRPEREKRPEQTDAQKWAKITRAYNPLKEMPDGRYFCDACMRAVHLDAEGRCPVGHTRESIQESVVGMEPVDMEGAA